MRRGRQPGDWYLPPSSYSRGIAQGYVSHGSDAFSGLCDADIRRLPISHDSRPGTRYQNTELGYSAGATRRAIRRGVYFLLAIVRKHMRGKCVMLDECLPALLLGPCCVSVARMTLTASPGWRGNGYFAGFLPPSRIALRVVDAATAAQGRSWLTERDIPSPYRRFGKRRQWQTSVCRRDEK